LFEEAAELRNVIDDLEETGGAGTADNREPIVGKNRGGEQGE